MLMKVEKEKKDRHILLTITLLGLLFSGSYQEIVPTFLDELFILLLIIYIVIFKRNNCKIRKRLVCSAIIYFFLAMITATTRLYYDLDTYYMMFTSLLTNLKPLLVVLLFSMLTIADEYRDYIFKCFLVLNIPSALYSIYQYQNRFSVSSLGLKMRNGTVRISGLAGHPITYGFILVDMIFIIFSLYNQKKIKSKVFVLTSILFLFALLTFTQSRLPQLLVILFGAFVFIWSRNDSNKMLLIFSAVVVVIILIPLLGGTVIEVLEGESSSVRMLGIQTGFKTLTKFPLLGCGLGTFGTLSSVECNSYVYPLFNVWVNPQRNANLVSGCYFEAGFFQKITENGLLGTICYFYIFVYYIRLALKKRQFLSFCLIAIIVLNSFFNPIYRLPGIFLAGICISNLNYTKVKVEAAWTTNVVQGKQQIAKVT